MNNFSGKHSILNVNPINDRIPGVQKPFGIVGMDGTWFCAHKEDNDLSSLNILLEGEPKVWYCVPPSEAEKFEELFKKLSKRLGYKCDTVLRHKCFITPPWLLEQHGIKYTRHIQRPGEIMITTYKAYHFGFNTGFNVCEAMNIASPKFLGIYPDAILCKSKC